MSEFNIPAEVKVNLLTERISALNLEGYQHELNLKTLESAGLGDSEQAEQAKASIATIKNAIAVHTAELEN